MAVCPFECTFRFLAPSQTSSLPLRSAHGQFSKGTPDNQTVPILKLLFHPLVSLYRQFCFCTFAQSPISPTHRAHIRACTLFRPPRSALCRAQPPRAGFR